MIDESKELPEDMYRFVMDELRKKDSKGKLVSPDSVVAKVRDVIQNHIEHRTQVTKATWEGYLKTYKS